MTIHNFYFVAAYVVWIYILLCFVAKLLLDRCKRAAAKRRHKKTQQFFMPSQARTKHPVKFSKILKYTKDDALFICACESYSIGRNAYSQTEQPFFANCMRRIFSAKAQGNRPQDVMENCLIASMEVLCGASASQTGAILAASAENAEMAEFWSSYGASHNSSVAKGGEKPCDG